MTGVSQQTTPRQKPAIYFANAEQKALHGPVTCNEGYGDCHLLGAAPSKTALFLIWECLFLTSPVFAFLLKGMTLSGAAMRTDSCGSPKIMAERAGAWSLQGHRLTRCWKGGAKLCHQLLRAQGGR